MDMHKITPFSPQLLRFYARCFSFPYAEQQYELQHLFRVMENETITLEESEHLDAVLSIINQYQGQEIKLLREDYVVTFTSTYSEHTYCPLLASDFLSRININYDPEPLLEVFWDNGISTAPDEPFDSIINYLEYLSLLCEQYMAGEIDIQILEDFLIRHVMNWIPLFCNQVEQVANLVLYKEIALGLRQFLLWFSQE